MQAFGYSKILIDFYVTLRNIFVEITGFAKDENGLWDIAVRGEMGQVRVQNVPIVASDKSLDLISSSSGPSTTGSWILFKGKKLLLSNFFIDFIKHLHFSQEKLNLMAPLYPTESEVITRRQEASLKELQKLGPCKAIFPAQRRLKIAF